MIAKLRPGRSHSVFNGPAADRPRSRFNAYHRSSGKPRQEFYQSTAVLNIRDWPGFVRLQGVEEVVERDFGLLQDTAKCGSFHRTVRWHRNSQRPIGQSPLQSDVAASLTQNRKSESSKGRDDAVIVFGGNLAHATASCEHSEQFCVKLDRGMRLMNDFSGLAPYARTVVMPCVRQKFLARVSSPSRE